MHPINPLHLQRTAHYNQQFNGAKPFKHVLVEDFFAPDYLSELQLDFPAFNPALAKNENGDIGLKAVHERIRAISPAYEKLDELLQSQAWLDWISAITGIPELRYDPYYFGGGTHDNLHGQELDVHIDFNHHPMDHSHRRLNLIVYLNDNWQEAWGGQLELHSNPHAPDDQVKCINPIANRCVIFETTEFSWHAFNKIVLPESEHQGEKPRSRKSIAIYLYTKDRPTAETGPTHSTIYVDRPLPSYLQAGVTLSNEQVQEIQVLMTRRDHHIQRLYRDISSLTGQLEHAKQALAGSRLQRLSWMLRRALQLWRR